MHHFVATSQISGPRVPTHLPGYKTNLTSISFSTKPPHAEPKSPHWSAPHGAKCEQCVMKFQLTPVIRRSYAVYRFKEIPPILQRCVTPYATPRQGVPCSA